MTDSSVGNYTPSDASHCPLCGQSNLCGSVETASSPCSAQSQSGCWCQAETLVFPAELLEKIPADLRGKACICLTCVERFNAQTEI